MMLTNHKATTLLPQEKKNTSFRKTSKPLFAGLSFACLLLALPVGRLAIFFFAPTEDYLGYGGLGVALLACFPLHTRAATDVAGEVDYFTNNGYSNTVGTMQHPAGEHYKGITYVAYQGPLEDPYVAAYDHAKDQWSGPFKAGDSILGKTLQTRVQL